MRTASTVLELPKRYALGQFSKSLFSEVLVMGHKVLLADDSITVQKIVKLSLTEEGIEVIALGNGEQAVQQLETLQPDLVMADVFMPGKDGYEVCEFVKSHPQFKHTPVILLVHAFEPFDPDRARKVGADQQLTKPFQSIRTLVNTVRDLLTASPVAATAEAALAPAPTVTEELTPAAAAFAPPPPALAITPSASEEFAVVSSLAPAGIEATAPTFSDLQFGATEMVPGLPSPAVPALNALPPFPFSDPGEALASTSAGFVSEGVTMDALPPLELAVLPDWSASASAAAPPDTSLPSFSPLTLAASANEAGDAADDVLDLSEDLSANVSSRPEGPGLALSFTSTSDNDMSLLAVLPPPDEPAPTNHAVVESVEQASFATAFDMGVGQVNPDLPPPVTETTVPAAFDTSLPDMAAPVAATNSALPLSEAMIEEIVNRVVQRLSTQAIQEIAWEVVPEMAELLIRKQLSNHPQLSH
jgi:CheY-like chemotaxis protein